MSCPFCSLLKRVESLEAGGTKFDPEFDRIIKKTLEVEGGYVNHPLDRGGATNFGITQRTYDEYRDGKGLANSDVKDISMGEVEEIYFYEYWLKTRCNEIPAPLNMLLFDASVNHGPRNAIRLLQRATGSKVDGLLGPKTIAAAERLSADQDLATMSFTDHRRAFFEAIIKRDPSQEVFRRGWMRRLDIIAGFVNTKL